MSKVRGPRTDLGSIELSIVADAAQMRQFPSRDPEIMITCCAVRCVTSSMHPSETAHDRFVLPLPFEDPADIYEFTDENSPGYYWVRDSGVLHRVSDDAHYWAQEFQKCTAQPADRYDLLELLSTSGDSFPSSHYPQSRSTPSDRQIRFDLLRDLARNIRATAETHPMPGSAQQVITLCREIEGRWPDIVKDPAS